MNHQELKNKILEYYDGELKGALRSEVGEHLAQCKECKEVYDGWARKARVFPRVSPQAVSSDFFVHQVMEKIREIEKPAPARPAFSAFRWFVPAAGIVLATVLFFPSSSPNLSVDSFFAQGLSGQTEWFYSTNQLTADDAVQLLMEGS